MAVQILRPNSVGHYNSVWQIQSLSGWDTYWENINEADQDGDANFIFADEPGPFTVDLTDFSVGSYPRPFRVPGVTVIATVRPDTPNPSNFRFRIRYSGFNYDSELFTVSSSTYVEVFKTYLQLPNGDGWNAVRLSDMEIGLVYVDGEHLRCTKLEVQVSVEPYPHYSLAPDGPGAHQDWRVYPDVMSPPNMMVSSFDGDLSYIYSNTLWTQMDSASSKTLRGVFGFSAEDVFAVGDAGTILHYGGFRWAKAIPVTSSDLYGVWGADPSNVFAVGAAGTILYWDGFNWTEHTSGVTEDLLSVWGSSATDVFAVGAAGVAVHYDGVSWTPMVTGTAEYLFSVHGSSTTNVFAVGTNGAILWWNGAVWAVIPPVTPESLFGVYVTSPTDAWAVGALGTALQFNGAVWVSVPTSTLQTLRAVTWGALPSGVTTDLYAVWGATDFRVFIVGMTDTILAHDDVAWHPVSTFTLSDLPATTVPPNIERVSVGCSVKNEGDVGAVTQVVLRSGGVDYLGATSTAGHVVPADGLWHQIEEEFINDPSTGWPSGAVGSTPWNILEVDALEIGLTNVTGDLRCTSMLLEAYLKYAPLSTFVLVPTGDGYYYTPPKYNRIDGLFPNAGESPWQDVMDNPPDYGATYIYGDTSTIGSPLYSSFTVTPLGAIPIGEQVYCVEHRMWVSLPVGSDGALLSPVLRLGGETYIGKTSAVNDTGASWFHIRNQFYVSPFTGQPWTLAELNALEIGVGLLNGSAWITSVNVEVQTGPLLEIPALPPDPTDLQLTTAAVNLMTRSSGDGTIYAVTEFAVGSGGFVPASPWQVVPVNPADVALSNEVFRAPIERISYEAVTPPWVVTYWCRVPRGVALGNVGELGLIATILWSPFPVEIGTKFLFAIQHFPCQTRHDRAVQFFQPTVEYP